MTTIESIKCDNCGKELICDTQYPHVYALELKAFDVNRRTSGGVFAVVVKPPIACLNTGRNFIGIEKDDNYFSIAKNRILTRYNEIKGGK